MIPANSNSLLNRWLAGLDTQMEADRAEAETVSDSLLAMAEMIGPVFQAAEGRLPLFLEFWMQAMRDPVVWKATIAPYHSPTNC